MKIHPNTPPKLVKKFHKCGSFHKLADEIRVNVIHIHALITKGKEPTHRTEKGRAVRAALYLPRRPRKHTSPKLPIPEWKKTIKRGIRRMKKATHTAVFKGEY